MTPAQLQILQHALGADQFGRRAQHSERNFFCAGAKDESDCRELVALGFMREHRRTDVFPYFNCSVTDAGIKAMRESSPDPPRLMRSQRRYERFLRHDSGLSFREWLRCYGGAT
jgi:hypothetical protein